METTHKLLLLQPLDPENWILRAPSELVTISTHQRLTWTWLQLCFCHYKYYCIYYQVMPWPQKNMICIFAHVQPRWMWLNPDLCILFPAAVSWCSRITDLVHSADARRECLLSWFVLRPPRDPPATLCPGGPRTDPQCLCSECPAHTWQQYCDTCYIQPSHIPTRATCTYLSVQSTHFVSLTVLLCVPTCVLQTYDTIQVCAAIKVLALGAFQPLYKPLHCINLCVTLILTLHL